MKSEHLKKYGFGALEFLGSCLILFGMYLPVVGLLKDTPRNYLLYAILPFVICLLISIPYYRKAPLTDYLIECLSKPMAMCAGITLVEIMFIGWFSFALILAAALCIIIIAFLMWLNFKRNL